MDTVSFAKPGAVVAFDGERCTPWVSTQLLSAHVHRYISVLELCRGKRVLDVACGEGFGSAMLIRNGAAQVTGADIDVEAIKRASDVYAHEGLNFKQCDIRQPLPFEAGAFDVVVCFETLEHIGEQAELLSELARVLGEDGVLVISTPDGATSDPENPNPFHVKELSEAEFLALIKKTFSKVTTRYQGYHFGSVIGGTEGSCSVQNWKRDGFLDYHQLGDDAYKRYIIAIASNDREVALPIGMLNDGFIIASLNKRIRELEAELLAERQKHIEERQE